MATVNMRYDHPAYITPVIYSGATTAGASGISTKWAAYTAMRIKSITFGPATAGTSVSTPLLFVKSGTATTTTTCTALTSATTAASNFALATAAALVQGDQFWVTHGTDATMVQAVAVECVVIPGSNVTA